MPILLDVTALREISWTSQEEDSVSRVRPVFFLLRVAPPFAKHATWHLFTAFLTPSKNYNSGGPPTEPNMVLLEP